jgi:LPS sulfotransferase NodH
VAESKVEPSACILCTAPRTGSSLLAEALASTGVLGKPEEYFDVHKQNQDFWVKRLGIRVPGEYLEKAIVAGTTANGVFGLKLHWHQIPGLIASIGHAEGCTPAEAAARTFDAWLTRRFVKIQYLWLRRRNKIAQAISYYRAAQSNVWRVRAAMNGAGQARSAPVPFDAAAIERYLGLVEDFDRQWLAFFNARHIRALVLIYEDLVDSYDATLSEVARFLGLQPERVGFAPAQLTKQADAVSLEWELAFRKLKGLPAAVSSTTGAGRAAQVRARSAARLPVVDAALMDESLPAEIAATAGDSPPAPAGQPTAAPESTLMPLVAYHTHPQTKVRIVTAPRRREWMDQTRQRHAYRCLPLVIANQYGWLLLCPARLRAVWNGGIMLDAVSVEFDAYEGAPFAASHFGSGILTFKLPYLVRTPKGVNLAVRGPANHPKDGITALEGIVETDWTEASFTMNWKFTRPNHPVVFERDEPFAMLTPVPRGYLERFEPQIRSIDEDPELARGYRQWAESRFQFNRELGVAGSAAQKMRSQRHYVRGETVSDKKAPQHEISVSLRDFVDKRGR